MFINKFKEKLITVTDSPIMTSYINLFFKTEVTCIPKLLRNYMGDYYNNALCNGATWVFVLWCFLHIVFDKLIDALLTKLRYREYVRMRLKNSLWYLGFYGTALVYSGAALSQNEVELFNFKRMHVPSSSNLPSQVVIGYTLISTFFLHSSLWEGLAKEYFPNMFSYLFLFLFLLSSYILRIVEISFTLTTLLGIVQVAIEFTRCCFMSSIQDSILSKLFVALLYFTAFSICFTVYIIVIPLTFVIPLGLKILTDYPNILLLFLLCNLVLWLIMEIYQSVLFKFVDHWFYHPEETESDNFLHCSTGLLECSLFKRRDDVSYNLQIIKKEIKARQTKMMSMRKPKNKSMLVKTLKCMVAIKRKLSEKRRSESSDSDSEKSEDSDLKSSENLYKDEDNVELLSDQEEDTSDESQENAVNSRKADGETKESTQNEESDLSEESENEHMDSQGSDIETEKENSLEETEGDTKVTDNKDIELDHRINKSVNSAEAEKSHGQSNIKVDQEHDTSELETKITNRKHENNAMDIAYFKGDNSAVQIVEEHTDSKNKNSRTLSVEGDNAKEINDNEDNDNNNFVLSKDASSDKTGIEQSNLVDERNNETSDMKSN